jgi:predicted nucleic acid-binding protein
VAEPVVCLDAGVWVKFLVAEEPLPQSQAAARLVLQVLSSGRLVAPSFAWAEVGSVLRKKVRQTLISADQAGQLWEGFCQLPIEYLDDDTLRRRTWELAEQHSLATLYDAAFMACAELAPAQEETSREFWTADRELVRTLGRERPSYLRELAEMGE